VVAFYGKPFLVIGFTVKNGRIVEIDSVSDPERLSRLDLAVLGE
jgi:RNA polymerase sigma-70 factor (ECF subfamily)